VKAPAPLYACHNKPREVPMYFAQDGYHAERWIDYQEGTVAREPVYIMVPHVMSTDCRYDRAHTDSRCAGCNSMQEKAEA
jgi:hypothetical protein